MGAVTGLLGSGVARLAPLRRVLRYDRRGFGLTRGPYNPAKACGDLLALLDAAGLDDVVLVGMSQGARVAIHTSILAPQRVMGLILDGAPWFEDETELPVGATGICGIRLASMLCMKQSSSTR